jgi:hypothetical protein
MGYLFRLSVIVLCFFPKYIRIGPVRCFACNTAVTTPDGSDVFRKESENQLEPTCISIFRPLRTYESVVTMMSFICSVRNKMGAAELHCSISEGGEGEKNESRRW